MRMDFLIVHWLLVAVASISLHTNLLYCFSCPIYSLCIIDHYMLVMYYTRGSGYSHCPPPARQCRRGCHRQCRRGRCSSWQRSARLHSCRMLALRCASRPGWIHPDQWKQRLALAQHGWLGLALTHTLHTHTSANTTRTPKTFSSLH